MSGKRSCKSLGDDLKKYEVVNNVIPASSFEAVREYITKHSPTMFYLNRALLLEMLSEAERRQIR